MFSYEYQYFDGEYLHTLNLINVNLDKTVATIAITCAGGISVKDFNLQQDKNRLYFEYGLLLDNKGLRSKRDSRKRRRYAYH